MPASSDYTATAKDGSVYLKHGRPTDDLRFEFGENWEKFLNLVNEERIEASREVLQSMLELESLEGTTFLDVGSGSGLMSLAAAQLGAEAIYSFDYDARSVACTKALKRRFLPECDGWTITQGDCLNETFLSALPRYDIVYAWGVLHHTGDMWQALDNVITLVKPGGLLYIAIYNDQGWMSRAWRRVKRFHCRGRLHRWMVIATFMPLLFLVALASDLLKGRSPLKRYRSYRARGMSEVHDWFDWLGGYPFEVAKPEEVFAFCRDRHFTLQQLRTRGGKLGCNEFVFRCSIRTS